VIPDRWVRLRAAFDAAAESNPSDRSAVVKALCDGDVDLEREVLRLLGSLDAADELLERAALVDLANSESHFEPEMAGSRIGPYHLIREIGRGGMGAVYEAVRADDEFTKRVAVKLIRQGLMDRSAIGRFRRERQILADLEHPAIARLLDGGTAPDGSPYLVMEFVRGEPIDLFCESHGLDLDQRLRIFLRVCEAVQYAHRKLVVHRDLKPANILVDADGEVKLLDFGVASLLGDERTAHDTLSEGVLRALTPAYASPEQLRGEPVSTSADVFSLGIVLFQLLTGRHPLDVEGRSGLEIAHLMMAEEIPRPSSRITAPVESGWPRALTRLRRALDPDLDAVVIAATRREPEHRYASVEQLAEDVRRHLAGLPVRARRGTRGYPMWKFLVRHRTAAAAAGLAAASLIAGTAIATVQAHRAGTERTRAELQARVAELERSKAEQINLFLHRMLGAADPNSYTPGDRVGPDTPIGEVVATAARSLETDAPADPVLEATLRVTLGQTFGSIGRSVAAEAQLRAAIRILRGLHAAPHADLATALTALGRVLTESYRRDEAEAVTGEAVELYRRLGPSTPGFSAALVNHGVSLFHVGKFAEAEVLLQEGLGVDFSQLPPDHPQLAVGLSSLATVLQYRGDFAAAERVFRQALEMYARLPATRQYWEPMSLLANYGMLQIWMGRPDAALHSFDEALAILSRTTGPEHAVFGPGLRGYRAEALLAASRLPEARTEIREAFRLLGPDAAADHPARARLDHVHGQILTSMGRPAEAVPLLRNAVELRRRANTPGNWRIAESNAALGAALLALGRYDEAEPLLVESHRQLQAALSDANPATRDAAAALDALRVGRLQLRPATLPPRR
jgi:eukaryotic-like serine/threonine-protein kinase